jgi:hypothetical protein
MTICPKCNRVVASVTAIAIFCACCADANEGPHVPDVPIRGAIYAPVVANITAGGMTGTLVMPPTGSLTMTGFAPTVKQGPT